MCVFPVLGPSAVCWGHTTEVGPADVFSDRLSWIQHIVVVAAEESLGLMRDIIQRFQHTKVCVVSGGATRHRSIFNGVLALDPGESGATPDVVIIHDAVRPFVEEDFLLEIAMAAKENGVCLLRQSMFIIGSVV